MKEIRLTQNKVALVDDEDFERLNQWKWCAYKHRNTFYAVRSTYKQGKENIKMHRQILNLKKGDGNICDHKNRNGLDNRKENLRLTTTGLNKYNCKKYVSNTSGYRGVSWYKDKRKWGADISKNGVGTFCGYYDDKVDAAKAYDYAAIRIWGEDAILNFPVRA